MPLEKCLKISDAPADFDPVVWMAMALLSGETGKLPLFGQFLVWAREMVLAHRAQQKSEWSMVRMKHWSNLFDHWPIAKSQKTCMEVAAEGINLWMIGPEISTLTTASQRIDGFRSQFVLDLCWTFLYRHHNFSVGWYKHLCKSPNIWRTRF